MTNIYDLANELERGIRALPEYKTLVEKKEAIAADAEASALFKEFTDFQVGFTMSKIASWYNANSRRTSSCSRIGSKSRS